MLSVTEWEWLPEEATTVTGLAGVGVVLCKAPWQPI